ncbi:hypothetical protein ACJIZ3_013218 [Penstemon smallii]|uniref:Glyoxysomal processing protease, glyoxysomal n=1 Tax=Penstemon smallii TaxID=265156 RepID=A0ABD3UQS0_9LAMI
MGLPEVADFTRNFAVMVRVQGPDPKGLKMRNHAFHHYNSGKTTLSASGMLFPGSGSIVKSSETVLVLTVASVIEPFVSQQDREKNTFKDKPHLIPGVQIDVLVEDKAVAEGSIDSWFSAEVLMLVNIPQSSAAVQSLIEASCGSIENGWEVGWSLASHSRGPPHIMDKSPSQVEQSSSQSHWLMMGLESSSPTLIGQSTSRIAVLAVTSKLSVDFTNLQPSVPKRGDLILAMGSPFGILSPLHFFNNISVGSIGNSYPPNSFTRSLLMADIRCLPGMEGSPVFTEHARFIGLLTRPLRQKISGTEIQLVIPWEAIASACRDLLHEESHITWKGINYNSGNLKTIENMSPVEKAMTSICLITTDDGSWASGVLINKQGLVLTNAHLLEPWRFGKTAVNSDRNVTKSEFALIPNNDLVPTSQKAADISPIYENALSRHRNVRVRLDFMDPWMWTDASVVYVSKGPLDIALLQLKFRTKRLNLYEQFPAMLQTTAAVHPGSSGGAVVNSNGCMIGLVTSNAKHGGGTVIPHLNFSIPSAALEPILKFSKDMQDFTILEEFDKPNEHLSSVWALMPPLYPKPEPLLPDITQFPAEDKSKDTKGSRFAKFIADRNELLKKTAQQGMSRSFTNELMHSKL